MDFALNFSIDQSYDLTEYIPMSIGVDLVWGEDDAATIIDFALFSKGTAISMRWTSLSLTSGKRTSQPSRQLSQPSSSLKSFSPKRDSFFIYAGVLQAFLPKA